MKLPDGYSVVKNQYNGMWYYTLIRVDIPRSLCNIAKVYNKEHLLSVGHIIKGSADILAVATFIADQFKADEYILVRRGIDFLIPAFASHLDEIKPLMDTLLVRFTRILPQTNNTLGVNGIPSIAEYLSHNTLSLDAVLTFSKMPK